MKALKLLLILIAASVSFPSFVAQAASDDTPSKTLGVLGGYNTRNKSGEAGIFFQYRFSNRFRIAPNITYITRRKGIDALDININAHFPLLKNSGRFNIYPLAGISYTSWNSHTDIDSTDDNRERSNKFGINMGGGIEAAVTPTLKLRFEGKWVAAKHACTGDFSIGIGYMF